MAFAVGNGFQNIIMDNLMDQVSLMGPTRGAKTMFKTKGEKNSWVKMSEMCLALWNKKAKPIRFKYS